MQKEYDLVIFDLDSTLIDGRIAITENFNFTLESFRFPQLEDRRIHAMIGMPLVVGMMQYEHGSEQPVCTRRVNAVRPATPG